MLVIQFTNAQPNWPQRFYDRVSSRTIKFRIPEEIPWLLLLQALGIYLVHVYHTFIAQFGGRHEDLFSPENPCLPQASPSSDMNFLGWTNLHVSRLTGQLIVNYAESWRSTYYQGNMNWIEVLHTLAIHSKWVRRCVQNLHYNVTAEVAAAQCRETWQEDMMSGGRHEDFSPAHVTSLDQLYFFICHTNYMRYNK